MSEEAATAQPPVKLKSSPRGNPNWKKGVAQNPKGSAEHLNTVKMATYRKRMAAAIPKTFTERQLCNTLKTLLEIRDDVNIDPGHRLRACDLILERMLGKAHVNLDVEVGGTVSVDQRILIAKAVSGLVINQLDKPQDNPALPSVESKQLPYIDPGADAGAVPAQDAGNLLHTQQGEREVLLGEFVPSSDSTDGAPLATEVGNTQEPEVAERVE